jgi:uncharacterized protein (TIGR02453 family)
MPDAANLAKVRQEIDYNASRLNKILKEKGFKKHFGGFDEFDKLKTMPKGYPKDHPHIELLKLKSYIVTHAYTDKEVMDKKFIKTIVGQAKTLRPLIDFLRESQA